MKKTILLCAVLALSVQTEAQSNSLYINNAGNVGIGTTSPNEKLSVAGNILVQNGFGSCIKMAQGSSDAASLALTAGQPGATVVGGILGQNWCANSAGGAMTQVNPSYNASALVFNGGTTSYGGMVFRQINLSGSPVDSVTIDGSATPVANTLYLTGGNVGIGTTMPGGRLSVENSLGDVVVQIGGQGGVPTKMRAVSIGYGDTYNGVVMPESAYIQAEWQNNSYRPILLDPLGGDVGIGMTNPQYALDVNGTVRAVSYIATTSGTKYADFVFKPGYKLSPLSAVEAAIKKDGHLPGIPSEADAKAHGIDLAQMQVKLLQQIEELTLHVIDQEKRIEQLEKENAALKGNR